MRLFSERRELLLAGAAVAVLASLPAAAQVPQTVRLEDAVAGTIKSSLLIQHDDEHVRRAAGQLKQAQGAFDWTINAESGWEQLYVPKAVNGVLTDQIATPSAIRTTLGIGRTFRNGISVIPGVTFYSNTSAAPGQVGGLTTPRPALNLTIPLFRGLGSDNLAATTERAASASVEGASYARDFTAQRTVYDTVQIYWRCLAARADLTVLDSDQHAAEDYVDSLRALAQKGQIEPTIVDRAAANLSVQRVGVSRAVTADENCRRDLGTAMGVTPSGSPPTPVGEFPAMDGMAEPVTALNEQGLMDTALANRHDLMALMRYDAAENEHVRGAENGMQPKVDIYVDPTKVLLRYSRSIGRDTERGQISSAMAAQNEARLNLEQARLQVQGDIAGQLRGLKEALTDWTALTQSAALLENVVSDSLRRANAGVISRQEYRAAQNELAQVRRQVIDAKLQYAASLAGLRLATGTIEAGDGGSAASAAAAFRSLPGR